MKLRFLKLAFILCIFLLSAKCSSEKNESSPDIKKSDAEKRLDTIIKFLDTPFSFQREVPEKFNFCDTTDAILKHAEYNTKTGIAHFSIPIPKGSNIKFEKIENDTIFFSCNGYEKIIYGGDNLTIYDKTITALPRGINGKKIYVTVVFLNFKDSECENPNILTEKKKTSEIGGQPLWGNDKE